MAEYFMYNGCKVTHRVTFTGASNQSYSDFRAEYTSEAVVRNDTSSTVTISAGAFKHTIFTPSGVLEEPFPLLFSVEVPAGTTKIIFSKSYSMSAKRRAADYSKPSEAVISVAGDYSTRAASTNSIIVPACPIVMNVSGVLYAADGIGVYLDQEIDGTHWWYSTPYINVNGVWREVT